MTSIDNHILIVDDEPSILEMLADYFNTFSYETSKAASAEDAIKILNSGNKISLIITDIDLPGMSGIELLQFCKATKPDIPIIIITGLKTLNFAISAIKHGAQDYVTKPFELTDVRKVVEKVLRYRKIDRKQIRIHEHTKSMSNHLEFTTREIDAGVVGNFYAKFLLNSGFCTEGEYHQLYVAFTETIINAIEHGNLELRSSIKGTDFEKIAEFEELRENRLNDPQFYERKIRVAFQFNEQCFHLSVTDDGPGFDWKKFVVENQFRSVNTESHGRGFILIRHIIDEVYFNEKGNSITLIKSKKVNEDA